MAKFFCVALLSTVLLSGCLATGPKGVYSQDTRKNLENSEAFIGVCRALQFTQANGRILTASVNNEQAANLIGGSGVEIAVPVGKQKITVTISGLMADVGALEANLDVASASKNYLVVSANNTNSFSDKRGGTTETFSWTLQRVSLAEFTKACPETTLRLRRAPT